MSMVLNLEMRRGDTKTLRGFLRDENNLPVDDPAAVYKLAARTTKNAATAVFEISAPQYAPGEGRCTIAPGDTSSFTYPRVLYYDLQVQEATGTVTTCLEGKITVRLDQAR